MTVLPGGAFVVPINGLAKQRRAADLADLMLAPVLRSPEMRRIDRLLQKVAPKDVIVTLVGESGTGKEVLARRVHELSGRRPGPFIPINCTAIPETLFESELFGHERGAFTGASERVKGKIESAAGGTLFLDEIGEMPLGMQAKLLRFLENRRFMRVGGSVKLQADVRLVFATLRPLQEEVRAGRFRADLYYRIEGITVPVPPLRERRADVGPLLDQFLHQLSARHGVARPRISRAVHAALLAYDWPGNIRELRNTVESLCLLRAGKPVRAQDLPGAIQQAAPRPATAAGPAPDRLTLALDRPLEDLLQQIIDATLAAEGGDLAQAAARLGISVRTIQRRLHRRPLAANP